MKDARLGVFEVEMDRDGRWRRDWLVKVNYMTHKGLLRYAAFKLPQKETVEKESLRGLINDFRKVADVLEKDLEENYDREPVWEEE